jgi:hypothetical protein
MAQIGWIDFSPEHRDRVAAVLDMLKPEGMVDELGIGSIRDAFADQLFPGISTIQTRAKYFFIIPYILYDYQMQTAQQKRKKSPEQYLEENENKVMWYLADKYKHKDGFGVIGSTKYKPQKIMRRPSAIYWNGLSVFGLVQHGGLGVDSFLRNRAGSLESLISQIAQGDDVSGDDADVDHENTFNLNLPYKNDWFADLSLDLTADEADVLSHRIRDAGKDKLIGVLMENKEIFKKFKGTDSFSEFSKFAVSDSRIGRNVKDMLTLAHDFSELMYGANITYNHLVQRNKNGNDDYLSDWTAWLENIHHSMINYKIFNPDTIFMYAHRVRNHTKDFVYSWWKYITGSTHLPETRFKMIEKQEYETKPTKARLRLNKYDDVGKKWIGLTKLEYRMIQGKRILQDVHDGLRRI